MSAPSRLNERPWEPEALELPLDRRPRPPTYPTIWPPADAGTPDDARRSGDGERAGSHVVVIDIA
jgi:hypothetical protein